MRRKRDAELAEELRAHLALAIEQRVARGEDRESAERAVRLEFGNALQVHEITRAQWHGARFERVMREAGRALRGLRRARSFTVTSVVVLGLAIGMATAMFTVMDRILLRPLPVRAPEEVVLPRSLDPGGVDVGLRRDEIRELASASRTMQAAGGVAHQGAFASTLLYGDRVLTLNAAWVTGNFFELLGARPALGRLFVGDDEAPFTSPSNPIVLSYETFHRDFGGDPGVIGRSVTTPYSHEASQIIGVAPPGLSYPPGTDYWGAREYQSIDVVARLAPGATVEQARTEFLAIMQRVDSQRVATGTQAVRIARADIRTFTDAVSGDVKPELTALTAAVVLLLLIACVNVGNLVLLRATSQASEFAVRRALGAATADIVRPLLWEGASLGAAGGVLGLGLAVGLLRVVALLAPPRIPRLDVLRLGGPPLGIAAMVTLLTVVLAGVAPALFAARGGVASTLRLDTRSGLVHAARARTRRALVVSQMALALIMVTVAGLLVRSLDHLVRVPLGYRAEHVAILTLAKPMMPDSFDVQISRLYERVAPAFHAIPGVSSITPVGVGPFYGPHVFVGRYASAAQSDAEASANALLPWEVGGSEYFDTFGIPLLRGRGFRKTDTEGAPRVVVVSRAVAERFWPGENPIGKQIRLVGDTTASRFITVVGEVGDIRYRSVRQATPTIFMPWRQVFFQGIVALRFTGSLAAMLPEFRRVVRSVDPDAVIARAESMDELVAGQRAETRLLALLLAGFACTALVLAALGVYGVMASAVRDRTRELGIRAALGASPRQLRAGVMRQAGAIALLGSAFGLAGALAASRFLGALLYDVRPADPLTMIAAFAILLAAAMLAAWIPAWRTARIDPVRVLRTE